MLLSATTRTFLREGTQSLRHGLKKPTQTHKKTKMSIEPSPLLEIEPALPSNRFDSGSRRSGLSDTRPAVALSRSRLDKTRGQMEKRELAPPLRERTRELIQLAREQGYLTKEDIHEAVSGEDHTQEDLDEVYRRLRSLEIEVAETPTSRVKVRAKDDGESEEVVESLDDPVRMYLKEMG